jgi:predicted transcriptional regulator
MACSRSPRDFDWFAFVDRLRIAVEDTNQEFEMTTIGEQLKAARAQLAQARSEATNAVAGSADAANAVLVEVKKVQSETADLLAELAEITNGGPALDARTPEEIRVSAFGPAPTFP